jgi:tetratricopeptide (TPR) repeat protein
MLFGSLFKKKVGGLIGCLGLDEFWLSCSDDEKKALNRYNQGGLNTGKPLPLDEGTITTSQTQLGFLSAMIGWAESDKNFALADKMIQTGMKAPIDSSNLLDAHYFWQNAAECYYKQRDERDDAISRTIEMCQTDIDMFPKYSKPMKKEFGDIPRITTFSRLIIVFEKMGRIDDAIKVCKLALKYKLKDNTKGGYEERLKKLEAKKSKA